MALEKGKILCLFGVKGGIGKSILSMNLAGVASNKNIKTLIIDMDIYGGSIGFALNKGNNKTIYNFVDDYNNNRYEDLKDYIINYNEYIDYIIAPKDPRQSNKILSNYLELLIDKAKFNYELIIIDTNHILNETNLCIMDKCDEILLVMSNNIFDMKNMKNLISIFNDLDKNNYKLLLNESFTSNEGYFNFYDIKSVIKNNIDYSISSKMYIKNIDELLIDGKIITLLDRYKNTNDYKVLNTVIDECLGENHE